MKWSVERSILAGFALALVILIAISMDSYRVTLSVEDATALRAHSNQVRLELQTLLSHLQDAETGQRGFLITGDETYLDPYNTAASAVSGEVAALRSLTADNPAQQQRLDTLEPLIAAKLAEMQQTIDLRRTQGFAAAQALVNTNRGQQNMDQIRGVLGAMQAEEDNLYQARDAALARQLVTVRWVAVGGGALAVLIVLLALLVIQRELNQRQSAEANLAHERDLLQVLMDHIPDTLYFKDRQSRFVRINRAQAQVLGLADPAAAIGKTDFDFQHPDVSRRSFDREQELLASGQPLIDWIEYVPTPSGAPRWFSSTKVPIHDASGQITGLVGMSRDVTEHQQAQAALEAEVTQRTRSLRMLNNCNQALVRATDEAGLLDAICSSIVDFGGVRLAWVGLAEHDPAKTMRVAAQAGDLTYFSHSRALDWADDPLAITPAGAAIRTGQVVIVNDQHEDPSFAAWRAQARQDGCASAICLPLGLEASPLGALCLYAAAPDAFQAQADVELLVELSHNMTYGLTALRTRAALSRSEAQLSETSRMAGVGGWELELDTQVLHWSEETYRIHELDLSVSPDLASAINYYAPEARPIITGAVEQAAAGTPFNLELPIITALGHHRWVHAQGRAEMRDGRAARLWGTFQDITDRRQAAEVVRQNAARAEALARLSKLMAEVSTHYGQLLETVTQLLAEMIGDGCALYLVSDDGQWVTPAAMYHVDTGAASALQALKASRPTRADEGLSGRVMQTGQSLLIPEVDPAQLKANLPPEYADYLAHYTICSLLCVALRAEGQPLGTVVMSRSTPGRAYTSDDQAFLEEIAGRVALVISNARLYAGLEQRVHDRTQALEAEIVERQNAEEELSRTGQFLESIIENIPDMIFVKDAEELRFVRLNRAGEALLGLARADLLGKSDYDLFPPGEADASTAKDRQVLAGHQLEDIPEEPIQTRNLGERVLHTKKLPILDEAGQPRYLLGISEDITERKQSEEEIRALNQALAQKVVLLDAANRELEAFSYSVSHDLRAPLRALDGFSQILLEDYADQVGEQGADFLRRVRAASQKMGELIDALLTLARVSRLEMRQELVDLSNLAQTSLAELRAAEPQRQVAVVIPSGLRAQGDPRLLRAVLDNLLGNAWKFTSKTDQARIEFGRAAAATDTPTPATGPELIFFVRDNGAGFDMAYADRLFGAFQRLHAQAEFAGSGIGLATVQRIVARHGGRVWAESRPGAGAAFYFTLPASGSNS